MSWYLLAVCIVVFVLSVWVATFSAWGALVDSLMNLGGPVPLKLKVVLGVSAALVVLSLGSGLWLIFNPF